MRRPPLFAAAALLFACGAPPAATGPASDGGAGSSPDLATDGIVDTKVFKLTPWTLQPGEERIQCQYVHADGKERSISGFGTDMTAGSHHLVVFRINEANTGGVVIDDHGGQPFPCSQLDIPDGFDGLLPGSQVQHTRFNLPDGVAMHLAATHGLLFQSHYINATQAPINTDVTWTIRSIDPARVKQPAGMLFYSNFGLSIPPNQKSTASRTCKAPGDIYLISATGHMHRHATSFDATVNDQPLYHTETWDEPDNAIFPSPGRL